MPVGFSAKEKAMDVARSEHQGAHCHAHVIYLLPSLGVEKGAWGLWYSELGLPRLCSRSALFVPPVDKAYIGQPLLLGGC